LGPKSPKPPAAPSFRCPRCNNTDVVPSLPRHFWDELMRGFGRVPKHCRRCDKRFYVVDRAYQARLD
jgi:transcription elongation factor Elf1